MDLLSDKILGIIFKRNIGQDMGEISMDADMLKVLSVLDGSKDVAAVSRETQISPIELRKILQKLYNSKLILKAKENIPRADRAFFDFLESTLADVMGPMARVIISDTINEMGETPGFFPVNRCSELVNNIASKFPMEDKKTIFLESMRGKLNS